MNKPVVATISTLLLLPTLGYTGVVMEMVTTDASGQETDRSRIYAQAEKMRMEQVQEDGKTDSMVFLGDKFLYIDHDDKSYVVMDEAMLDEVSTQMSEAMKEMEAQLAAMPPEQRAMVEQMMKGQMQGMMQKQAPSTPAFRVEAEGGGKWKSYKCREYAVYEGDSKVYDICAADLDEIDGADEVVETFRNMAAYISKMTESMPMRSGADMNIGELMDDIDGFPVHTVDYENGVAVSEMSLESVAEKDLDEGLFAVPDGYRRLDPMAGR